MSFVCVAEGANKMAQGKRSKSIDVLPQCAEVVAGPVRGQKLFRRKKIAPRLYMPCQT